MYGEYYLLLDDGGFVCYDQINEKEVAIYSVKIKDANGFSDIEQAKEYAKAINSKGNGYLTILTSRKVVNIMSKFDI